VEERSGAPEHNLPCFLYRRPVHIRLVGTKWKSESVTSNYQLWAIATRNIQLDNPNRGFKFKVNA
jgi:hypothetical protein